MTFTGRLFVFLIPFMFIACTHSAEHQNRNHSGKILRKTCVSDINFSKAGLQNFIDGFEQTDTPEDILLSTDTLYGLLNTNLSSGNWNNANQILLLLHYTQICSLQKASAGKNKTFPQTIQAIYSYEMERIIPLLQKYAYPKNAIDFHLAKLLAFAHKKLKPPISSAEYNLVKDMYIYFACV